MTKDNDAKPGLGGASKGKGGHSVKLNREIQTQLGDQLRQMYNDVVGQGVPDKFVDLLAKLENPANGDKDESPK